MKKQHEVYMRSSGDACSMVSVINVDVHLQNREPKRFFSKHFKLCEQETNLVPNRYGEKGRKHNPLLQLSLE